jgi:hypothetical protein
VPVRKFRSIEEMDAASRDLWSDRLDEAYFDRLRRLWRRSVRLDPRTFPKGVIKYRSLDEAQADRDRWLSEHIAVLRRERAASGTWRIVQEPTKR